MRCLLAILVALWLAVCAAPGSAAQTRRALLVGINIYQPASPPPQGRTRWFNLDGAVNDAEAMRAILIGRYGFKPQDILVLKDADATRTGILAAIRKHLIDEAAAGDTGFFFYSGHGSQVTNSRSRDPDHRDQSIVPADSYRGALDIRNKELARLFNQALDKGVQLTAVFDSCHSGGIARGLPGRGKHRFLPPDQRDVADPDTPDPPPEERGALILSAALDFQRADEADDQGTPHGLFTLMLLKTLRAIPVNAPVAAIFARTKALMSAGGTFQEPVLAGTAARRQQPLFGTYAGILAGRTLIAVLALAPDGRVELAGGTAVGLTAGSELTSTGEIAGKKPVRLRITRVRGLNRSEAAVVAGPVAAIRTGDLFGLDLWVAPDQARLRVWMPPATFPYGHLAQLTRAFAMVRESGQVRWIDDPTRDTPTHVISWDGAAWQLTGPGGADVKLGNLPSAALMLSKLPADGQSSLFVHLPPTAELADELRLTAGTMAGSVEVTTTLGNTDYFLVGRLQETGIQYAWVHPDVTQGGREMAFPLPVRTDWRAIDASMASVAATARELAAYTLRIGRVAAWLRIEAPPDEGRFPYRLALKHTATGELKTSGSSLLDGQPYGLVLQADELMPPGQVERRFVYVFAIDSFGRSQLLFPAAGGGNVKNRLPYVDPQANEPPPVQIELGRPHLFTVGPPYGLDAFILISSREPIPDPDVLVSAGVRTRGPAGSDSALARLLAGLGATTRGERPATPLSWSIDRVWFRAVPPLPQGQAPPGRP